MSSVAIEELVALIESTLCEVNGSDSLSTPVLVDSAMGEPTEWDSLAFIAVLTAVAHLHDVGLGPRAQDPERDAEHGEQEVTTCQLLPLVRIDCCGGLGFR